MSTNTTRTTSLTLAYLVFGSYLCLLFVAPAAAVAEVADGPVRERAVTEPFDERQPQGHRWDPGASPVGAEDSPAEYSMSGDKVALSYPARRQFCDRFLGLMDDWARRERGDAANLPRYRRARAAMRTACVRAFDAPGLTQDQYECMSTIGRFEHVVECPDEVVPFLNAMLPRSHR